MAYLVLVRHGQSAWNALGLGLAKKMSSSRNKEEWKHAQLLKTCAKSLFIKLIRLT